MSANPVTDQVVANLHFVRAQIDSTPQPILDSYAEFGRRITGGLPDIDPAVIGEVLLHAGELWASFATNGVPGSHLPLSAVAPVRMLTEAGYRLYAPESS